MTHKNSFLLLAAVGIVNASVYAADTTPPSVTAITPAPGTTLTSAPTSIVVTFSEEVDASTISGNTIQLIGSGGDGTFRDGNEVTVTPASVTKSTTGEASEKSGTKS